MSTESIASSSPSPADAVGRCASCGAPLAADQRYCLECGERRVAMSSVLAGAMPAPEATQSAAAVPPPATPPSPPRGPAAPDGPNRNSTLTVIAGVGVLLLAMGVGVLIGRSGNSSKPAAAPEVITVGSSGPNTGTATTATTETTFKGDWPSGKTGFTVELQTLPKSGTAVSAVEAAKTAASAKGATAVGALESSEFSSLSGESYVIYAGDYGKRAEAQKALGGLKKSFPAAKVVEISNGSGSAAKEGSEPPAKSPGGVGESESKPAKVPSVKSLKGKNYEEKAKNIPDVVETP